MSYDFDNRTIISVGQQLPQLLQQQQQQQPHHYHHHQQQLPHLQEASSIFDSEAELPLLNVTRGLPVQYVVILFGYITPVSFLVTVVANIMIVVVLSRPDMRSPTNLVLLAMAVADLLTLVFPVPWYFYMYTLGHYRRLLHPAIRCNLYNYMSVVLPAFFHTASIWCTLLLACQRYIYICHPSTAKIWCTNRRVAKIIGSIFLLAFAHQFPRFLESHYVDAQLPQNGGGACRLVMFDWVKSIEDVYFLSYFTFRIIFVHIGPCLALVIFNVLLYGALKRAEKLRHKLFVKNYHYHRSSASNIESRGDNTTTTTITTTATKNNNHNINNNNNNNNKKKNEANKVNNSSSSGGGGGDHGNQNFTVTKCERIADCTNGNQDTRITASIDNGITASADQLRQQQPQSQQQKPLQAQRPQHRGIGHASSSSSSSSSASSSSASPARTVLATATTTSVTPRRSICLELSARTKSITLRSFGGGGGGGGGATIGTNSGAAGRDANSTTIMLIVVVTVFLIVEIPLAITTAIHVAENMFELELVSDRHLNMTIIFSNFFIIISYPLNFAIYCGMSRAFRETFQQIFIRRLFVQQQQQQQQQQEQQQQSQKMAPPLSSRIGNSSASSSAVNSGGAAGGGGNATNNTKLIQNISTTTTTATTAITTTTTNKVIISGKHADKPIQSVNIDGDGNQCKQPDDNRHHHHHQQQQEKQLKNCPNILHDDVYTGERNAKIRNDSITSAAAAAATTTTTAIKLNSDCKPQISPSSTTLIDTIVDQNGVTRLAAINLVDDGNNNDDDDDHGGSDDPMVIDNIARIATTTKNQFCETML